MKTTSKPARSRTASKPARSGPRLKSNGAAAALRPVVPLNDRRLRFGDKWAYAPAPEAFDYIKIAPRHELFIDGKFVPPAAVKYFDSINPATEEKLSEVAHGGESDVDRAVQSARRAFENVWGQMPGRDRSRYLFRIARIIQEKSRELAILETMDGGKPIKETRDIDLPLVAAHFFTTPAGQTSCSTRFRAGPRRRSAWPGKSFRGIFPCSWPRGKLPRRSRAATRWSSSLPRPPV